MRGYGLRRGWFDGTKHGVISATNSHAGYNITIGTALLMVRLIMAGTLVSFEC